MYTHDDYFMQFKKFLKKDLGFTEKEKKYDKKYFGNFYYIYEFSNILLRIIRDRGQYFIEIRSKKDAGNWYQLETIVPIINPHYLEPEVGHEETEEKQIEMYTKILNLFLNDINRLFSNEKYEEIRTILNT